MPYSDLIRIGTREGMKLAKAKGRLRDKPHQARSALVALLYRAGEHTVSELEELFAITRPTIYSAIARADGRTASTPAVEATA